MLPNDSAGAVPRTCAPLQRVAPPDFVRCRREWGGPGPGAYGTGQSIATAERCIESSRQRPCTGPGTESVSQTRAAAQNRLLAVPFQQDIAFMHIHVANDHYRHASQTTKSSCGAPTADRRVSEAATGPRSQLPGGRYVHGVEVTARIRQWRRMDGNGVRVSLGKAAAAPDSMMDAEKLTRWQGSSSSATGKEKHEAYKNAERP